MGCRASGFLQAVTDEEELSLNNNRSNRRRGRGNRSQGGGQQLNRIDSRARGNAPQLLEKYKKLAQDAQHNGDRVQAEYYLQFADHYFRVIADNKARQDEQRGGRREEREPVGYDEDEDFEDRRPQRRPRDRREDEDEGIAEGARALEGEVAEDAGRHRAHEDDGDGDAGGGDSPRRGRRPRKDGRNENRDETRGARRKPRTARDDEDAAGDDRADGIDLAALPPPIAAGDNGERSDDRPRRRRRLGVAGQDDGDESLQATG